jgi:uncharacterized protein (TIGR03083 family)
VNPDLVFAAVADERRRLADLLDGLDEEQLATPSLCAGWDVKTVAAHLVSDFTDGFWGFQLAAVRHCGVHRGIDQLARRRAETPATEIARTLRERAETRLSPPVTGPRSGLTDVLVHGGDIKIPLGLPFEPDVCRVAVTLDFLTGPTPFGFLPRRRLRGISLCATDVDRTWGRGAEISGPASALMMTVLGRDALRHRLDGPGLPILLGRLSD